MAASAATSAVPGRQCPTRGPKLEIPSTKTNAAMDFIEVVIIIPFSNEGLTESTVGQTVWPVIRSLIRGKMTGVTATSCGQHTSAR